MVRAPRQQGGQEEGGAAVKFDSTRRFADRAAGTGQVREMGGGGGVARTDDNFATDDISNLTMSVREAEVQAAAIVRGGTFC